MSEQPQLRRAWLRGYRQGDVELAVARATLANEQLQHELSATSARANAMQTEIAELHRRVDAFRERETELATALEGIRERQEQVERDAANRAQQIVSDAEQRSASLRTEGLRQVGELQRWKTSFSVRPQAVCTARFLFAVTGPSTNDHFGPPRLRSRSCAKICSSSHHCRISSSSDGWSGTFGSGWNGTPEV